MTNKIRGFNFKKAFIIFFAALLAFTAITVIYGLSTGGWQEAMGLQNSRMEARASGDIFSIFELRAENAGRGQGTIGDRVLRGFAGLTTRITSAEFTVFNFIAMLFKITFVALIATFVYTKVQNRRKRKLLSEQHQHSNNV